MTDGAELKQRKSRKIYVFSTSPSSGPMVTELNDDEEGLASLSNMMRVETVLAAVIGDRITLDLSSVVTLIVPGRKQIVDRMPIEQPRV